MSSETLNLYTFYVNATLALLQFLSLIALIVYVVKTSHIAKANQTSAQISAATLKQMQEEREAEVAPSVVAFFDVNREKGLIYIVVSNIGKSIAKSVKLEFDPPLKNTEGTDLSKLPLITNGVGDIPPNHEVRVVLDYALIYMNTAFAAKGDPPLTYNVKISYGVKGKSERQSSDMVLDLTFYKDLILK